MTATLLLFCTFILLENFVIADNVFNKQPLAKDLYHVKKERFINGPKLINKRVSKAGTVAEKTGVSPIFAERWSFDEPRTKAQTQNSGYTVFPPFVHGHDVPSSLFFTADHHDEDPPKLRVKKVLPDFWNPTHDRKKRSPDETPKDKAEEEKKTELKEVKEEKSVATSGDAKKGTEDAVQPKVAKSRRSGGGRQRGKKSKKLGRPKIKVPSRKMGKKPGKRSASKTSNKNKNKGAPKSKKGARKGGKKDLEGPSRRLIAARDALIENFPYVVSIQKDDEHWCAGALLNQRLVVTTANCVWKSDRMSRMMIRAGSRHVSHGGQLVGISEVLKHPLWSIRKGPDFDIALLLTSETIKFSHSCHAVDLPNRMMTPVFEDAWVTSWGSDRRDGVYEKRGMTLQVFHARLTNRDRCNNVTMRYGVMVTENFICLEQLGRRAPCTRDTGAPAVSDGVLWGLASWGIRKLCGTERFPAMFTYTASMSNMDFIINGTVYMMSEERLSPFLDRFPFAHARNITKHRVH